LKSPTSARIVEAEINPIPGIDIAIFRSTLNRPGDSIAVPPNIAWFSPGRNIFVMLGVVVNTGTKSIAAKKPTVFNFEMEVSTLV
jgi:hypothetical protein